MVEFDQNEIFVACIFTYLLNDNEVKISAIFNVEIC